MGIAGQYRTVRRLQLHLCTPCVIACATMLTGCGTFSNVPRGTTSLLDIMNPQTSPAEAAEMATDQYSAENRYKGTTLLSNADFGGNDVYISLYLDGIVDTDPSVRAAAARALGRHGDPEHVGVILKALTDPEDQVRLEAARALQRVHSPLAVSPLMEKLDQDKEPVADIRAAAADALGQYLQPEVVKALVGALRDSRLVVNNRVQHSLLILTGQNFGLDRRAWIDWYNAAPDMFAGAQPYTYPVFNRKKKLVEYLPMVPPPPNESTSIPVGMDPVIDN